jgi:enamine deaminase RidA (YjgF/YER057c/UK114 family)
VQELYLTAVPPANARDPLAAVRAVYESIGGFLATQQATVVHEKLYAPASLYRSINWERQAILKAHGVRADDHWTLVSGRSWEVGRVGGAQVHAMAGGPMRVSDIQPALPEAPRDRAGEGSAARPGGPLLGRGTGKVVEFAGARSIYLSSITGVDERGELVEGGEAQARQMFENARALLEANGSNFSHVVRTWVYLPHILQWYREFNAARTAAYERFGVFDESWPGVLPGSTGIQGAGVTPAQCLMDLVAMEALAGEALAVSQISNPRQSEATSYGSSFSRAVEVSHAGVSCLNISGTASINELGETMYVNDLEAQIFHTMLNVGALLQLRGTGWEDVCVATAFFKKAEYSPAFDRALRTLGVPRFPVVPAVADVCRPELLFELEATAVYTAPGTP